MSDDPGSTPPKEPLEYWHTTGPVPLHPAVLMLIALSGFILGAGIFIVAGFFLGLGTFGSGETSTTHRVGPLLVAIAVDLAALGLLFGFIVKVRRGRTLAIELRRRAFRSFALGFLLGCGIVCLLEGICFTVAGVNS